MPPLQPAGFFSALGSFLSPKKVMAQVRSETLPNGKVQLTPFFTIDVYEVPSELVKVDEHQTILGYSVVLTCYAEAVHKKLQGKSQQWAKGKAATILKELQAEGIDALSTNGRVQPRIETLKPEVNLELHDGDSLKVVSELQTAEGAIFEKPTNLDQLVNDGGWYAVGDDLLKVELTNSSLDQKLVIEGGNGWFTGDDVPRMIDGIERNESKLGEINKNDQLRDLAVFTQNPENRADIDGDAEKISISPSLADPEPLSVMLWACEVLGSGRSLSDLDEVELPERRASDALNEASYICDACGEEIVIPLDLSEGIHQTYVEDCPVCCRASTIHVEMDGEGHAKVWAEPEQDRE